MIKIKNVNRRFRVFSERGYFPAINYNIDESYDTYMTFDQVFSISDLRSFSKSLSDLADLLEYVKSENEKE